MPYIPPNTTKGLDSSIGAVDWNVLAGDVVWLNNQLATPHGCSLRKTTATGLNENAFTTIPWNSDVEDTDNYHSPALNADSIVIPNGLAGVYTATYYFAWFTAGDPLPPVGVQLHISKNGTTIARNILPGTFLGVMDTLTVTANFVAGDIIRAGVYVGTYPITSLGYDINTASLTPITASGILPASPSFEFWKTG